MSTYIPTLPIPPSVLPTTDPLELYARRATASPSAFAPLILGLISDALLLGVVIIQFQTWWRFSSRIDHPVTKCLVYWLLFMSFAMSGYILAVDLNIFAVGFGTYKTYLDSRWSSISYILAAISRIPAGLFFAERAWRLSGRSWILAGLFSILWPVSLIGAIGGKILTPISPPHPAALTFVLLWLVCEAMGDVVTTLVIGWCLSRTKTGWSGTDKMIGKLVRLTIETQLPPIVLTIGFMISYLIGKGTPAPYFFHCAPKVHVVCLLAVLNSRMTLRSALDNSATENEYTRGSKSKSRRQMTVDVHTETITHVAQEDTYNIGLKSVNGRPGRMGGQYGQSTVNRLGNDSLSVKAEVDGEDEREESPERDIGQIGEETGSSVRLVK